MQSKWKSRSLYGGALIVVIGVMVGLVLWNQRQPGGAGAEIQPGQTLENQGRDHVGVKKVEGFEYNSNPPTSGPHYGEVPPFGIYDQPLHDGYQIHLLEHGAVIIHYKTEDQAVVEQLRELARTLSGKDPRIVLMPNPNIDSTIALTAWARLDQMNEWDENRIQDFFNAYVNEGPEKVSRDHHDAPADAPQPIEQFD